MNQDVHDGRWHRALGRPKTVRSRAAVPWVIAGLAVVAGAALAGATTAAAAPVTVGAGAASVLYVTSVNSGSVTPVNTATNLKGTAIRTGRFPFAIAVTPDAKTAYVADSGTDAIVPINTATNKAGKPIKVGAGSLAIAITPNGSTAYVITDHSPVGTSFVTPVNLATRKAGKAIKARNVTPSGLDFNDITMSLEDTSILR